MVTRCCLSESSQNFGQSATEPYRGPQRPIEGHRGLWRAKSKQMWDQINWQRRRKLFPWWSKMFFYSIYVYGLLTFTSNVSLKKFFLETQLSFASFRSVLAVVKSPECSHCWKYCKNCERPRLWGFNWMSVIEGINRMSQARVPMQCQSQFECQWSMPQIGVSISKLLSCHWIVLKNISEVQNFVQYFFQKMWGFFVFLSVKNWKELLMSDCYVGVEDGDGHIWWESE